MEKKYYWLRLKDDFFSLTTTKLLRKMPEGDKLTIIYLKLQLLSLKNNGALTYHKLLPNLADELAVALDEESQYVNLTLSTLQKLHLIEPISNDEYLLTAMNDLIGIETKSAKQKREYRKKIGQIKDKKETLIGHNSDITRTMSDREEKRIDKEEIKNIKEENILLQFEDVPLLKKSQSKKSQSKGLEVFNFDGFLSLEIEAINLWLAYKKENNHIYKTSGLTGLRNDLIRLKKSSIDIVDAINYSISKSWNGIYPEKNLFNYQPKQQKKENFIRDAYIDDLSGFLCVWDYFEDTDSLDGLFCPISTIDAINGFLAKRGSNLRYNDLQRRDTNTYTHPTYGKIKRLEEWQNWGDKKNV